MLMVVPLIPHGNMLFACLGPRMTRQRGAPNWWPHTAAARRIEPLCWHAVSEDAEVGRGGRLSGSVTL